ncbi:unnamed protein product [Protopolystoma xenopodis]|uniref:Uncharacterized protein n=1 Tax=Protopolystoma xenopodis TaxID=117903 RepID=A0A3S5CV56_9PLAT|nr:unnamed protein product [Protopolystoma xenopodis]
MDASRSVESLADGPTPGASDWQQPNSPYPPFLVR